MGFPKWDLLNTVLNNNKNKNILGIKNNLLNIIKNIFL